MKLTTKGEAQTHEVGTDPTSAILIAPKRTAKHRIITTSYGASDAQDAAPGGVSVGKGPLCGAGEPLGDDAEGAQPCEMDGCGPSLEGVRRAGKSF